APASTTSHSARSTSEPPVELEATRAQARGPSCPCRAGAWLCLRPSGDDEGDACYEQHPARRKEDGRGIARRTCIETILLAGRPAHISIAVALRVLVLAHRAQAEERADAHTDQTDASGDEADHLDRRDAAAFGGRCVRSGRGRGCCGLRGSVV